MKKKFLVILATLAFACVNIFAQTNTTVKLSDDVYELLDIAETRGLCSTLKIAKPYTQSYIVSKLEEIYKNLNKDDSYASKTEVATVKQYLDRFSTFETNVKELQFVTSNTNDNLPLRFGVQALTIEGMMSGGLYQNHKQNSFGFEEWNTLGFVGDLGKNVSFEWRGGVALTEMPLQEMTGKVYHIGNWWNETGGYLNPDSKDYPNAKHYMDRFIHTYKNYSVLPYSYTKYWDGSIYNLTDFNASGLKGWPNKLSFGMHMQGGIEASFFNDRLYLGISRKNREWGGMDFGASLALNAKARPFLGMEASIQIFDWLSFGALTGFLEFPNSGDVRNAWYIPQEIKTPITKTIKDKDGNLVEVVVGYETEVVHQDIIPSARDSYFFQDMFAINVFNFDFKYFHFDFGSTCIFPKRFELGYMFPLFEKIVFQNSIGDYDNLGLYGSIAGKLPGVGSIWFSAFIDEINAPNAKTMFRDSRCMFALQAGLKTIFPVIPFGKLSFRYTRVEPFCYTHTAVKMPYYTHYVASSYTNNGSPLGYYLDPNSDEFFFRIDGRPLPDLSVGFQYQLIRHGATWGDHSVEGSSIYSELEPYNRDSHHKYFLKDGAYEWTNIIMLDGSYDLRRSGLPMQFTFSAGYIYDWFTLSGEQNKPADIRKIEKNDPLYDQYPTTNGVVLSVGFKFFAF